MMTMLGSCLETTARTESVNFLAHFHLADGDPGDMTGGVAADFVRNPDLHRLSADVLRGVARAATEIDDEAGAFRKLPRHLRAMALPYRVAGDQLVR